MKNLDVTFTWNNVNKTSLFEIPTNVDDSTVESSIKSQLTAYNGNTILSISHTIVGSPNQPYNYSKGLASGTTSAQIQTAINSAVTIIGGRSRRG